MEVLPLVKSLVKDPSPAVRREAALALRYQTSPEAAALWAELAQQHDGRDRWYLEALGIAADTQWDAFLAAWLKAVGEGWNTPAGRDILWRSRARATPEYLVKIVSNDQTPPADQQRYLRAFDFLTGPEKDAALLQLLSVAAPEK